MEKTVLIVDGARQCVGYEGLYVVTQSGEVYGLPKRGRKLRRLKPVENMKGGYLRVSLSKDGDDKLVSIHRLVAEAYIPNHQNMPMVNHMDGNKKNNHVDNLEWVDGYQNRLHAFELGLYPRQRIHPNQKKEIYDLVVVQGVSVKVVAERYGLKPSGVYSLVSRYREAEQRMAA